MAICTLSFTFNSGPAGSTPPLKTSLDFQCGSALDMETIVGDVDEWWTAAADMRGQLSDAMDKPIISAIGVFSGVAVEYSLEAATATSGTAPDLPGASLRAIKLGNRPPGGRRGSMFWPGLSGSATAADGTVDAPDAAVFKAALDGLLAAIEITAGAYATQVHNVGGVASDTAITEFSIAPTLSFLQRRYR